MFIPYMETKHEDNVVSINFCISTVIRPHPSFMSAYYKRVCIPKYENYHRTKSHYNTDNINELIFA